MTLKTIALTLLLCVFAIPASADADKNAKDAAAAKSLYKCDVTEDCIVVDAVCPNTWSAINKKHQADHSAMTAKWRPSVDCLAVSSDAVKPATASCVDHVCQLEEAVNMSKIPGLYECTTAEDCAVAEGICPGWWISVNKMRVPDQEAQVKKNRPLVKCKKSPSPDKPALSYCVESKCTVKKPDAKP